MYAEILTIVIFLFVPFYLYFRKCYTYWQIRNVPFEKPTFLFGSFLEMAFRSENIGMYFAKLYKKFDSPYFGVFLFNQPYLVIKDPKILKIIQVKEFKKFSDKFLLNDDKIDPLFANFMMTVPFRKWSFFRPYLSRLFSSAKLKRMVNVIKNNLENVRVYIESLPDNKLDIAFASENYSTDVIATCFFGIDLNSFTDKETLLKHHITKLFPRSKYNAFRVYSYFFIHTLVKIFKYPFVDTAASKFLTDTFESIIQSREETKNRRNDLIDFLIDLKGKARREVLSYTDQKSVIGQAISFFIAGQETSSIIISCTLHELCTDIKIQERLREEINAVAKAQGGITYDSIKQMTFLDMVVSESLRRYPVIGILQRKCQEDLVLPETNFKIERGTNVIIPLLALLFDEEHFPGPTKYDPERFNETNKSQINPYVYQPFGVGPRNCIGKRFALLNVKMALATLIHKYKFELRPNAKTTLSATKSHLGHQEGDFELICLPVQ